MQIVYFEKDIADHPRANRIITKLKPQQKIECLHYSQVFNSKMQNFRIQKQNPALILAKKDGRRIMKSPEGFGIGGTQNYYFSHMLNCLYDCRYCFLQGMYSSANYVVFVNYEDFMNDIAELSATANEPIYFFSGYDCDSLAYEPVTHFVREFIPFFAGLKNAVLELRTKSTNVKELLQHDSYEHCVVAFSFTPEEISKNIEHKVPSVAKRIEAMRNVAKHGWKIGLRFDPLIYHEEFKTLYKQLIQDIFSAVNADSLHSVSMGPMRFPEKMYQKIVNLYPSDPLLAQPLYRQGKLYSYRDEVEENMKTWVTQQLYQYVDKTLLFECKV